MLQELFELIRAAIITDPHDDCVTTVIFFEFHNIAAQFFIIANPDCECLFDASDA